RGLADAIFLEVGRDAVPAARLAVTADRALRSAGRAVLGADRLPVGDETVLLAHTGAAAERERGDRQQNLPGEHNGRSPGSRAASIGHRGRAAVGCGSQLRRVAGAYQSRRDAIAAPSTSAASFLYATSGATRQSPANVPNPQSAPAITRSRPTMSANWQICCAISSGCST